ncbi:MAG: hypothetical protein Tsb0013_22000 [Phycisphaerales bacterium]
MKVFLGMDPGYRDAYHVFPFAKTITTYFEREGVSWTLDPEEPGVDVALLTQWSRPVDVVERLKGRGVRIVHRLDGRARSLVKVYEMDEENRAINRLADWTVYQSAYVRDHTTREVETFFGPEPPIVADPSRASLIYNGVDRGVFNEWGEPEPFRDDAGLRVLHVSFGSGVRKGVGEVVRLAELLRGNERIRFYCLGRQGGDIVWGERLRALENVTELGPTGDRERIAAIMRACDVLLFPSVNDYCPNTVLEAMACGLPVIYHDSGGTPEIVRDGVDSAGLPMIEQNPVYPLYAAAENLQELSRRAVAIVERRFRMERMGQEYLSLFRRLLDGGVEGVGDAAVRRRDT